MIKGSPVTSAPPDPGEWEAGVTLTAAEIQFLGKLIEGTRFNDMTSAQVQLTASTIVSVIKKLNDAFEPYAELIKANTPAT